MTKLRVLIAIDITADQHSANKLRDFVKSRRAGLAYHISRVFWQMVTEGQFYLEGAVQDRHTRIIVKEVENA